MEEEDKREIAKELGLEEGEVEDLDDETLEIMRDHDLDKDDAEKVKELSEDLGIDIDDAVELKDEL